MSVCRTAACCIITCPEISNPTTENGGGAARSVMGSGRSAKSGYIGIVGREDEFLIQVPRLPGEYVDHLKGFDMKRRACISRNRHAAEQVETLGLQVCLSEKHCPCACMDQKLLIITILRQRSPDVLQVGDDQRQCVIRTSCETHEVLKSFCYVGKVRAVI